MDIEVVFNRYEAALWLFIAGWIAIDAGFVWIRTRKVPRYQGVAVVAFAVFGVSDIIESFTGAWWTPWWLFVMKVACVLFFIYCFTAFKRSKGKATGKDAP